MYNQSVTKKIDTKIVKKKSTKKTKRKVAKRKVGRPTVMTKDVIRELERVFKMGGTDEEACAYAEISSTALTDYQVLHPEFTERKLILKAYPILKARTAVYDHLDDPDFAFKFLERKKKDEFAPSPNMLQQFNMNQTVDKSEPRLTPKDMKGRLTEAMKALGEEGEYATTDGDPDAIIK